MLALVVLVISVGVAVEAVTPHKWCYDDFPILDGLLCYQECKAGYHHQGGGPVCWAKCPPETTNVGIACTKYSYGRGVGSILNECASGVQSALLCYPACNSGYVGVGPVCWQSCNSGYTDDGALCRRNAHIYGRNVDSCPWQDKCGLCGGPWYNICCCRRNCGLACNAGYHNDGCTCRRDVHIYAKATYGRGVGTTMTCTSEQDQSGALCYDKCKLNYKGVGPVCWATCSGETTDTGTQCQKKSYGRGVGKAISCLQIPTLASITNVSGLVSIWNQTKDFQGLQAVGCSYIYLRVYPWMQLFKTFNKCLAQNSEWTTLSLSFTAGASAGSSLAGEIGLAVNFANNQGLCFVGYCGGVKLDTSIGVGIAVGWWKNLGVIPGKSKAYEVGLAIPKTDIGFSATFIVSLDTGAYIGTQFEFSVGLGDDNPFTLGFATCDTPESTTMKFGF